MAETRIYFATDLHGSELCFRKFVASKAFYKADVLVLGGDICGKGIVPLIQNGSGYRSFWAGKPLELSGGGLDEFEKRVRYAGFYPVRRTEDEYNLMSSDEQVRNDIEQRLVKERLLEWLSIAESKLGCDGSIYFCPGNDDDLFIDELFQDHRTFAWINSSVCELSNGFRIAGLGGSNPTPWDTPREFSEEILRSKLQTLADQVGSFERVICSIHTPPFSSGIDECPEIDENLKAKMGPGMVPKKPVGSTAVAAFIQEHQPLLGLFGHVHEGRGAVTLGNTVCVNPGSTYAEGTLSGALVTIRRDRINVQRDVQFHCG